MLLVLLTDETARSHPRERTELFPLLRSNYQRELQRDGSFSQVSKRNAALSHGVSCRQDSDFLAYRAKCA